MPTTLTQLEQQRSKVLDEIAQLGDLRRGSVTTTTGTCGKVNCHCHQAGDPGHGPTFRLTYKVQGKTVSEYFSTPAALQKAQREVAEYQRFRQLSQSLVEVNERICRQRPLEEAALSAEEKKRRRRSSRKWLKK